MLLEFVNDLQNPKGIFLSKIKQSVNKPGNTDKTPLEQLPPKGQGVHVEYTPNQNI